MVRKALSVIEFSESDTEVRLCCKSCNALKLKRHKTMHCKLEMNKQFLSLGVIQHLFGVIASVLHLGNIKFEADVRGFAILSNNQQMHWVSKVKKKTQTV